MSVPEGPAGEAGPAQRRSALVVAALVALAVAGIVVLIASAHVTPVGHGHPVRSGGSGQAAPVTQPPSPTASTAPNRDRKNNVPAFTVVLLFAGLLATAAGILVLLWVIRSALRRRSLPRLRIGHDEEPDAADEIIVRTVESGVDLALSELVAGGPVDDAIIRCWVQLEDSAARAGMPREAADTPEEAIERVFAAGRVRAEPLRRLAALYREARFSQHAMGPSDAEAARAALFEILDDLQKRDLQKRDLQNRDLQKPDLEPAEPTGGPGGTD